MVNAGNTRASLDGLALGQQFFSPEKAWPFPHGLFLDPGEYMIVFCDNDPDDGPLHANFKLTRGGDRVYLFRLGDPPAVIDSLSFGPLPVDGSYGIWGNGDLAQLLVWPTPGAPNIPFRLQQNAAGTGSETYFRMAAGTGEEQGRFQLRWLGAPEALYRVQQSDDLAAWSDTSSGPEHLGEGVFHWSEAVQENAGRFYRVVAEQ